MIGEYFDHYIVIERKIWLVFRCSNHKTHFYLLLVNLHESLSMACDVCFMKPTIKDLIRTLRSQVMLIRDVRREDWGEEDTSLPTLVIFIKLTILFICCIYYLYYLFIYILWHARGICIQQAFKRLTIFNPFESFANLTRK